VLAAWIHGRTRGDRSARPWGTVEQPDRVTFPSEAMFARTFNERTLRLLRVIIDTEPESIRETARLVERDVKNELFMKS
jgi:predicted transcriptional regulator